MASRAFLERAALSRFNRFWEDLYDAVPEARKEAVRAMGEAAQQELNRRILAANLEEGAKADVQSWQSLNLGKLGGYAALRPDSTPMPLKNNQARRWRGNVVTTRMVTKWLERGHGVPGPASGSRTGKAGVNLSTGKRFVKARMFYSWTRMKALDLALAAADKVLSKIADEVDY